MKQTVLIIGSGGREHALAWKIAQSKNVEQVYVAPGNAGTALEAKINNVAIDVLDFTKLIDFVKQKNINLTIVGPEAPLAAGIVDAFQAENLACFGPSQASAQLEASKTYSKDFMHKYGIPTASHQHFTDSDKAKNYLKDCEFPIVIKADGLAAGKGVIIAQDYAQACTSVDLMLDEHCFGNASNEIIIEEFLQGEEASFIVIVDGKNALPFATSQDHKARDDGDKGPNTGGMGAYSPAAIITPELHAKIMAEVIQPTVAGMAAEGHPYVGFLYAGLMISRQGDIKVLEFNCRFGDPETQPIMLRLQSDLLTLCQTALEGGLAQITLEWDPRPALGVVLAAGGYPSQYAKGDVITGLEQITQTNSKVFHAGTIQKDANIVTNGGRVLCATALGSDITHAQQAAYDLVRQINWPNMYYRHDIGHRALTQKTSVEI